MTGRSNDDPGLSESYLTTCPGSGKPIQWNTPDPATCRSCGTEVMAEFLDADTEEHWVAERHEAGSRVNTRLHLPLPESAGINGYHYIDGTSMRCVGCGRFLGTLCVAIEEGYTPPVVILPYDEGACPVCNCFEALIDTWKNPHTGSPNAWPKGKPRPLP